MPPFDRVFIGDLPQTPRVVTIAGWVAAKRDHGQILFVDLTDSTGTVQVVVGRSQTDFAIVKTAKEQSWLVVTGEIKLRPTAMRASGLNGAIELTARSITLAAAAHDYPWGMVESDTVGEELRLRYRYLDLKSNRLRHNLRLRSQVVQFIRCWLHDSGFCEIETPYITRDTPEGAREFVIPSRQQPGTFYALPQSPQQFKQLLMVGGVDRYFSIARCFRDEDPRGDRQPEFTQLDLEMSFASVESILELTEKLFLDLVRAICPDKRVYEEPFPRLTYADAMAKYRTDKPDLRRNPDDSDELAFSWITDIPLFEYAASTKKLIAAHHLFTRPKKDDEALLDTTPQNVRSESYDLVLNGFEIGGGSIRIHERQLQEKIFRLLGLSESEARAQFGHMLDAFGFGAPPHGGIASGIDRLCMILAGEKSIREVIAFPKTGDGRDLMMGAPAPLESEQLRELGLRLAKPSSDDAV